MTPREKGLFEDKELFNQIYKFKMNPVGSPPPIIKTNMFILLTFLLTCFLPRIEDEILPLLQVFSYFCLL